MSIQIDENFLRQVSRPVTTEDAPLINTITQKIKDYWDQGWVDAVGYAAIQLGFPVRFAIYKHPDRGELIQLINPVIVEKRGLRLHGKEGCMSIPHTRVNTWRYTNVVVKSGLNGETIINATGKEAQILQHEIDHFDGVLCMDRTERPFAEQSRNEPCECGSGVKFKKCCGA